MVTMDLLGGCGGDSAGGSSGEDEVVDLDVKVPVGWERRLDLSVSSFNLFCSYLFSVFPISCGFVHTRTRYTCMFAAPLIRVPVVQSVVMNFGRSTIR
jgi:hypothetical protein